MLSSVIAAATKRSLRSLIPSATSVSPASPFAAVRFASGNNERKPIPADPQVDVSAAIVTTSPRGRDVFPADAVSGVPPEISRRPVRIYRPANTPTQSGSARSNHWRIDFDSEARWENPLMGWSSSADPVQAIGLKFMSKEDAILFAERQGYDYWIDIPKEPVFKVKSYADNFKVILTKETSLYPNQVTTQSQTLVEILKEGYVMPLRLVDIDSVSAIIKVDVVERRELTFNEYN
ncbi:hypothetical protein HDV05_004530 [Chytridiales sp. JEL 0842]|nr:hypothetical protein HDV05_004530 [Chytridiales sp. JEL 0842]